MQKLNVGNLSETAKNRAEKTGEDRGRFCVLTKSLVFAIIFKGENNAKTSPQKK